MFLVSRKNQFESFIFNSILRGCKLTKIKSVMTSFFILNSLPSIKDGQANIKHIAINNS